MFWKWKNRTQNRIGCGIEKNDRKERKSTWKKGFPCCNKLEKEILRCGSDLFCCWSSSGSVPYSQCKIKPRVWRKNDSVCHYLVESKISDFEEYHEVKYYDEAYSRVYSVWKRTIRCLFFILQDHLFPWRKVDKKDGISA